MKVVMPDGKAVYLPGGKSYEERKQIVDELLIQHDQYFSNHFDSPKARTCLDMLTTYMARAKEFRKGNKHKVLGSDKGRKLYGGERDEYNLLFDDLPQKDKLSIGLDSATNYSDNSHRIYE